MLKNIIILQWTRPNLATFQHCTVGEFGESHGHCTLNLISIICSNKHIMKIFGMLEAGFCNTLLQRNQLYIMKKTGFE